MTLLTRLLASIVLGIASVHGQGGGGGGQQVLDEGNGQRSVPLRTHSLYAPYLDSDLQSRW
jgi:lectin, mannose-binding 2